MRESLKEYCLRYGKDDLLEQWHPVKNEGMTPDSISYGSQKKVWWQCSQGHEWQSPPYARTGKNSGCPYCSGKKIAPGQDLQTRYPDLADQWHPDKNGQHRPDQVLPGSHDSVWWRCSQGHEWKAMVKSRVKGNGCPVCANKTIIPGQNDFKTLYPSLAMQWHPTKNGKLMPDQVSGGSVRRVWWRCERGHVWQAEIATRIEGKGCPVCAGKVIIPGENDLESYDPKLARQWVQERNGFLRPSQVSVYSNRRVWWRCERGHEWQSTIAARTMNLTGCPYCAGRKVLPGFNDLKTLEPLVAAQWHPTRNETLEPTMVTVGCSKKVWWRCSDGHEWKAVIYSRTGAKKCGCPVCAGRSVRSYE